MELQKTHCRNTFTFGAWNVRGLSEKKRQVFAEIQRENEDVIVLTETKLRGSDKEKIGNYIHLYSGVTYGPARAGVSIIIKKELGRYVKWEAINERILKVKLTICGQKTIILGVYWVDDSAKSAVKNLFQENLRNVLGGIKKDHEIIILGDFNSSVGSSINNKVVGEFGGKNVNNNGRRLISLCQEYNLKIQNTFFDHEDIHKYTWYHSRNSSRTIIDFCITRQISSLFVDDVLACRWLECNTDHIFLEATISFPRAQCNDNDIDDIEENILELRSYKDYMLYSKSITASYKDHLESEILVSVDREIDYTYNHLKECVHSAAFNVLGYEKKNRFGEFFWDKEIMDLRRRREQIRKTVNENKDCNSNQNSTDIQYRTIKNEVWEGICSRIDNTNKCKKIQAAWNIINELQNKSNIDVAIVAKELTEDFYKTLFKENRIHAEESPTTESIQDTTLANCIHVDVTDIVKALNALEDYVSPTPGGLTVKLLRYSSHKTKKMLCNIVQTIFDGGRIPPEINETLITCTRNKKNRWNFKHVQVHTIMRVIGIILKDHLESSDAFKNIHSTIPDETCLNVNFVLRMVLQKNAEKQNDPFHIAFIDLGDIYSDIEFQKLYGVLRNLGVNQNWIKILRHLFQCNNIRLVLGSTLSETFYLSKGLLKEFPLSLTLFKMCVHKSLKKWKDENDVNGVKIANRKLSSLMFNDNLVVLSDSKKSLEIMILSLYQNLKKIGFVIPLKNIRYLGDDKLKLSRTSVSGEKTIDFLGSILELDGKNVEDIHNRILETKKAIGILHPVARDELISKKNKKGIFKSIIRCFLSYGCETWTLTKDLKSSLEAVEINYWKWCCENYPDRYSKQEIRDLLGIKQTVFNVLMLKKAAWYAKVKQMEADDWPMCVLDWEPRGTARARRPRKKWLDDVEEFLNDITLYENHIHKREPFKSLLDIPGT